MVKSTSIPVPSATGAALPAASLAVRAYLVVVVATLAALAVLSGTSPHLATQEAWGHAVVVAVFAVVLPLRLRRARAGRRSAVRAVGLIGSVLFVVNVVEVLVPDFVPAWMRVQMVVVAVLMLVVVLDVIRWAVSDDNR